jgi:hypothetical protein
VPTFGVGSTALTDERPAAAVDQSETDRLSLVERLNARFRDGKPSDSFTSGGVVVHQFDGKTMRGTVQPAHATHALIAYQCVCSDVV